MSKTGCFEGGFKIQGKQKSKKKERKKHKPVELLVFGGVREHNLSEHCMIHFPILLQYAISRNCHHFIFSPRYFSTTLPVVDR
jgi:hypothetical protein